MQSLRNPTLDEVTAVNGTDNLKLDLNMYCVLDKVNPEDLKFGKEKSVMQNSSTGKQVLVKAEVHHSDQDNETAQLDEDSQTPMDAVAPAMEDSDTLDACDAVNSVAEEPAVCGETEGDVDGAKWKETLTNSSTPQRRRVRGKRKALWTTKKNRSDSVKATIAYLQSLGVDFRKKTCLEEAKQRAASLQLPENEEMVTPSPEMPELPLENDYASLAEEPASVSKSLAQVKYRPWGRIKAAQKALDVAKGKQPFMRKRRRRRRINIQPKKSVTAKVETTVSESTTAAKNTAGALPVKRGRKQRSTALSLLTQSGGQAPKRGRRRKSVLATTTPDPAPEEELVEPVPKRKRRLSTKQSTLSSKNLQAETPQKKGKKRLKSGSDKDGEEEEVAPSILSSPTYKEKIRKLKERGPTIDPPTFFSVPDHAGEGSEEPQHQFSRPSTSTAGHSIPGHCCHHHYPVGCGHSGFSRRPDNSAKTASVGSVLAQLCGDEISRLSSGQGYVINLRLDVEKKDKKQTSFQEEASSTSDPSETEKASRDDHPKSSHSCHSEVNGAPAASDPGTHSKAGGSGGALDILSDSDLCALLKSRVMAKWQLPLDVRTNLVQRVQHVEAVLTSSLSNGPSQPPQSSVYDITSLDDDDDDDDA